MSGKVTKLLIESYKSADRDTAEGSPDLIGKFEVMINPVGYNTTDEVIYDEKQASGESGAGMAFKNIKPQEISFEFTLDGTGVATGKVVDVAAEIAKLKTLTVKIEGESHRTPYLRVVWGKLVIDCVLKSLKTNYSLFMPDGKPLRAKISITVKKDVTDSEREREDNKQSPDLTHYRTLHEGQTLQLMSYEMYGDPKYYLELAKANGLDDFRNIEVGTQLYFPPIDNTTK